MGAQRSACSPRVNGCLNPGLIHRRSGLPNKHAHSWVEINISPLLLFHFRAVLEITWCIFFFFFFLYCVQRWTSRAWSSPLSRRTAWTASATARRRRRRTTTASRAAPATPATQPHIPTDCSRTTVKTPRGHPASIPNPRASLPIHLQLPTLPTTDTLNLFLLSWPRLSRKHMGLKCHSSLPDPPDH